MKLSLAIPFLLILASCAKRPNLLPSTEYVLTDNMTILADTPNGRISVTGGKGTQRIFSGDGWTKTTYLIPRATRWYGSLGLYDPADSWSPHGRLLVDEGRLFFDTESEALRYLYVGSDYFKPVFNSRGLVVSFHVENIPGGEPTRSVHIWQIYIKGKVPDSLRGADDQAITVTGGNTPDQATPHPAPVVYEKTLGDHEYVPEKKKSYQ